MLTGRSIVSALAKAVQHWLQVLATTRGERLEMRIQVISFLALFSHFFKVRASDPPSTSYRDKGWN
eukprot:3973464-Amphidinium_carterae.1